MAAGNNIVGEVGLKVVPIDPNAQFQAGVDQIIKRLEKQAQFQVRASGLEGVQQQADNVGNSFANAAFQAAGLTAAVFAIKAAVEGAIGKLSGLFDQLAQARAGFNAILNSPDAGGRLLDDIREFARVSPFVTQELVNYSQQLLGVGVTAEKIIPLLTSTGDIISSVGGDTTNLSRVLFTLTQIKSIGVLKGQDSMQLQNSLIPITKYLSDYLHKTSQEIVKMREAGLLTADIVFAALNQQGEKVKGAMDRATRNISGARAILNDTITQLFQNQPALNKVFDDVFNGILKLSNFLSTPEATAGIQRFFEAVEKVYTSLKPVGEALAALSAGGGLTALKAFSAIMETLATALDAIPQIALKAIATIFITLGALKTPFVLIAYVQKLAQVATGALGAASGVNATTKAMLAQEKAAIAATYTTGRLGLAYDNLAKKAGQAGLLQRGLAKAKKGALSDTGVGLGLALAGGQISDGENGARDAVGQVATYAGLGATLGPAGAVAGGLFGMVTAITSASKAAAAAAKKAGEDAALAFATGFIDESARSHAGDVNAPQKIIDDVFGELRQTDVIIANYQASAQKAKDEFATLTLTNDDAERFALLEKNIKLYDDMIKQEGINREKLLADPRIQDLLAGVESKLALIAKVDPTLVSGNLGGAEGLVNSPYNAGDTAVFTGQKTAQTPEELDKLIGRFNELGISIEFVNNNSAEAVELAIKLHEALPNAFKEATDRVSKLNEAMIASKAAAVELFKPFVTEATNAGAALTELITINDRFSSLVELNDVGELVRKQGSAIAVNGVGLEIFNRAALINQQTMDRTGDATKAVNEGLEAEFGLFEILQKTLGLTDAKFKEYLKTAGLYNAYLGTADVQANVVVGTVTELAEKYGILNKELLKLLGIDPTVLSQFTQVTFGEAGNDALERIIEIQDQLNNNPDENGLRRSELGKELDDLLRLFPQLATVINPAVVKAKEAAEAIWGPFLRMANEYISAVDEAKALNSSFGSLFTVTEDNVVALSGNIDDTANVARDILARASVVYDDVFAKTKDEVQATNAALNSTFQQFELLQNVLGLTDEEFKSLLDTLGLVEPAGDAITGTFSEVATQMGITEQALAKILDYIGAINTNVVITVTVDAQEAQKELDRLNMFGRPGDAKRAAELQAIIDAGTSYTDPSKPDPTKKKAEDDALAYADKVKSATQSLVDRLEGAAENIATAAESWVHSIKERTQFESSISATRAISNTQKQIKEVVELAAGIAELKARGLSDEAIKSLGIDNVSDLKQVRKLLKANPNDLTTLSAGVSELTKKSVDLATTQEDTRTRKNIAEGIIEAATTLGLDLSKTDATALAGSFEFNINSDPEAIAAAILGFLTNGVSR